jgi:hypothetical protein
MLRLPYWNDSPLNEPISTLLTHDSISSLSQKTVHQSFQLCISRATTI